MTILTRNFVQQHQATIDQILLVLHNTKTDQKAGETILLYIAGLSLGHRQANVTDRDVLETLARAWTIAVQAGDEEENY